MEPVLCKHRYTLIDEQGNPGECHHCYREEIDIIKAALTTAEKDRDAMKLALKDIYDSEAIGFDFEGFARIRAEQALADGGANPIRGEHGYLERLPVIIAVCRVCGETGHTETEHSAIGGADSGR